MRIMSRESSNRVYHRPECRYVGKIRKKNRIQMEWEDAEWKGYPFVSVVMAVNSFTE